MLIPQFEYFWGPYCSCDFILSDECPIQSLVIYDNIYIKREYYFFQLEGTSNQENNVIRVRVMKSLYCYGH